MGVQRYEGAEVSDEDFEVVPSVSSQTYVSVDRLEISNGDVRQGAHGGKLRGGHSPGGKLRNINTLEV